MVLRLKDFITIAGDDPISGVTRATCALETSNSVCAVSISVAVVSAFNTLIHICTHTHTNCMIIHTLNAHESVTKKTYSCRRCHSPHSQLCSHSRSYRWCSHSRHLQSRETPLTHYIHQCLHVREGQINKITTN